MEWKSAQDQVFWELSMEWKSAKKDLGDVGNDFVVGVEAHSAKAYKIILN